MNARSELLSISQIRCFSEMAGLERKQQALGVSEQNLAEARKRVAQNEKQQQSLAQRCRQAGRAASLQVGLVLDQRLEASGRKARKQEEEVCQQRKEAQKDLDAQQQALALALAHKQAIERIVARRGAAARRRRAGRADEDARQTWVDQAYRGEPKAVNSPR